MEQIKKYLQTKGFEIVEKKTTTQALFENLLALSFNQKKNAIIVKFSLFNREDNKARATAKENKQRVEFLKFIERNKIENVDITSSPVITFNSEKEVLTFLSKSNTVELIKEYAEFSEVNSEFQVSQREKDGIIIMYRGNIPTEEEIVRDVFLNKEYERKGLTLTPDDVVLDLGCNIGCFSLSIFNKVKKVIAFEPEQVNATFTQLNIENNNATNIIFKNKAVIGGKEKTKDFYLGKVPYYYSFLVKNKRKKVIVECDNINDVIAKYKPTKMKIDIEGSEFDVLINCKDFSSVKEIIFEYNFDMNKDLKNNFENFDKLKMYLKKHGFNVNSMEKYSKSKSWAEVFFVYKEK